MSCVKKTRTSLTLEDSVRQLFVQISMGDDLSAIEGIMAQKPGGVRRFMGDNIEKSWSGDTTRIGTILSSAIYHRQSGGRRHGPIHLHRYAEPTRTCCSQRCGTVTPLT